MRDRANRPNLRLPHAVGRFTLFSLVLLVLGCFLVASAGATTLYYHPLIGSFGPGGAGSEAKFYGAPAVAVDQGSHDIYALAGQKKAGEPNFYRFTASGEPAPFSAGTGAGTNKMVLHANAIAVAPPGAPGGTAGDIYATVEGKVEVYSSTGAHLGTIDGSGNPNPGSETAGSLAVDPAGDLYIGYSSEHLDKYVPTANPPLNSDFDSQVRFEGQAFADLAFTSSALYITVGEAHGGHWFRYPSTAFPGGKGSATLSPEGPGVFMYHTLTTDFSNGDLYTSAENYYLDPHYPPGTKVNDEHGIDQYDNAGNLVSFTVAPNQVESDFDVDATSGRLYVPINYETERDVRIYGKGEPVEPPTATIDPVTNFDFKSAHFTGTVNPGGSGKLQEIAYRFECKPECPGLEGQRVIPGDGADHTVSDYATELQPATKYEVTLIAWNTTIPAIVKAAEVRPTTSFQTLAKPPAVAPEVTIDPVTGSGAESAHLSGTVDPKGTGELQATSYRFEYSSNGLVWTSTPEQGPIEGEGPQQVSTVLEGLEPNTTYRVRLHAKNLGGETTSEEHELNPTFTTEAPPPLVEAKDATHVLATSAQLNGHIDPRNSHATYHFQYVTEADFETSGFANATSTPVAPAPPLRDEVQTIQFFNLGASGIPFTSGTFALSFEGLETVPLPYNASAEEVQVALEALASVGAGNVSVVAGFPFYYRVTFTGALADRNVDPVGCNPTNLGKSSGIVCPTTTVSEGVAANAAKPVSVSAELTGLSPATTYRYRLIAANATGEATSQDASFATEASTQSCANARSGFSAVLPDCRAYEMVSPVDKRGADVVGAPGRTRSSSDGEAVSYGAVSSFGDSAGSSVAGVDYMSVRGPEGWLTHPLSPFQTPVPLPSGFSSSQFTGEFSGDLEDGVFRGLTPVPGTGGDNVAGVANLYLASGMRSGTPHFQLLSDAAEPVPPVTEETSAHIAFAGATADFKHVVFETHDNLTPDASGQGEKAYEWTGGEERLVGILPDSACVAPPCIAPESVVGAGALLDIYGATTYTNLAHAISEDGSRIFFTAGSLRDWNKLTKDEGDSGGLAGSLYVRIDGQSTVQIDASERSTPDPNGPGRSHFLMATPDGKMVFFLSQEELVNADTDGSRASLYRYEADAPEHHHLSLVDTAGVTVSHIVAMTPDAGYMYFVSGSAKGQLILYVKHGSDVHRIALDSSPTTGNNFGGGASSEGYARWDEVRMSADGRRLLFGSSENQGLYAPYNPEATELYLYDYSSDQLTCVSCSENGTSLPFPASFNGNWGQWIDVGGPGYAAGIYNNTPLSSDGHYVFFSTRDSLVAADTNGHLDAYSYDVETGKLHLISTGQCNCDSLFLTASPSGRDVFFVTHQQLVRADFDNLSDIYDARIGGGIAVQNAPPAAECQGDACQAPPSPPIDVTPASVAFSGAGNLSPPPGKAKKHHKTRHGKHARRRSHGRRVNSRRRAGK